MQTNTAKAKLKAGESIIGPFVRYPAPELIEFLALQGWDFILIDCEHGALEPRDAMDLVRAADFRGVMPIVRVPTNQQHIILRYMDTGAGGCQIPWVNSGPEAEAAVQSVKYHPRGIRGLAGTRAADYGQLVGYPDYVKIANAETMIIVHIETVEAVEHIDEIVAVEDIDVIFIGPTDLSHSYGAPGNPEHPDVQAAMQRIIDAVEGTDKILGTIVRDPAAAKKWQDRGVRYLTLTLETLLRSASRDFLHGVRD